MKCWNAHYEMLKDTVIIVETASKATSTCTASGSFETGPYLIYGT